MGVCVCVCVLQPRVSGQFRAWERSCRTGEGQTGAWCGGGVWILWGQRQVRTEQRWPTECLHGILTSLCFSSAFKHTSDCIIFVNSAAVNQIIPILVNYAYVRHCTSFKALSHQTQAFVFIFEANFFCQNVVVP